MAVFYNTDGKASYIIRYIFHKERKCGFMIESRCGIKCGSCTYKEQMGCAGCLYIQKPFWGESCPVKSCVEENSCSTAGSAGCFHASLQRHLPMMKSRGMVENVWKPAAAGRRKVLRANGCGTYQSHIAGKAGRRDGFQAGMGCISFSAFW